MRRRTGARGRGEGARRALRLRHHADAHLTATSTPPASVTSVTPLRLRLRDFRNLAALDFEAPAERLLLTGGNGAGKTSLLEAIYLAATSKSFRAPRLEACLRRGAEDGFSVRLDVGAAPRRTLEHEWKRGAGSERRLDGKTGRVAEQLQVFPLLVWTHAETELVLGPPAVRRRFLDRALVLGRPGLLDALSSYGRALGEKRALLASGGSSRELAAWNDLLARHGATLVAARAELVEALGGDLDAMRAATRLDLPPLGLRYRPSLGLSADGGRDGEAALRAALERIAADERERRQPLAGPHRDEFEFGWAGAPARHAASAGERKLVGLLLLGALGRHLAARGRAPALVVDDADAELDRGRLEGLLEAFGAFPRLLLSSNRPEVWPASAGLETVDVGALAAASGGGPAKPPK